MTTRINKAHGQDKYSKIYIIVDSYSFITTVADCYSMFENTEVL